MASSKLTSITCACFVFSFVSVVALAESLPTLSIILDSNDKGREFEGIGAVSAGASTRNLVDFPEKERSEVLDYLFKPGFGASLQHLKVEVGGGENSTCGSEPSHAITRGECLNPKARGYEFWFMAEARKRNPKIMLDCLPWCYPAWVTDRFSQNSADWLVAFLDVAKRDFNLNLDWLSASQNEMGTSLEWITTILKPTLEARGYGKVKLQGPDDEGKHWKIFDGFEKFPAAEKIVEAVGYHYFSGYMPYIENDSRAVPEKVKATGKPLWASEDFSKSGRSWSDSLFLAQLINKAYIRDRITKVEVWCPVDGITPGVIWSGTGLMQAYQSWSGHYDVWPAIWVVAHTTQFAQPGWRFMDQACGKFSTNTWKGTYVSLRNPATRDWSMILCPARNERIHVQVISGLKQGPVHVWKSTGTQQFIQMPDIPLKEGAFDITLDGGALYTFTTTTGQQKGAYPASPAAKPFPLPYREDFDSYSSGVTPKYLSDQKGSFETAKRPDGGNCLQQIVPKEGILWAGCGKLRLPFTVLGDTQWTDYSFQSDVLIKEGGVEIGGRYGDRVLLNTGLELNRDGSWSLGYWEKPRKENWGKGTEVVVRHSFGKGIIPSFNPEKWHTLKITYQGKRVTAFINGVQVAQGQDETRTNGMAYLASSYDPNGFDNLVIEPVR